MHLIEAHRAVEDNRQDPPTVSCEPPLQAEADHSQIIPDGSTANSPDLRNDTQVHSNNNNNGHISIVINSVRRVSSALIHSGRGVVHSSSSSISGVATEIELEPYSRCISTAPTLHSRSSTPPPPPTQKERGNTHQRENVARGKQPMHHRAYHLLAEFWSNNISVVVPGEAARDHLAIERTYLAYHRTSMVFALLATVVAQLFVLNHKPNPDPIFGFHAVGKPLAVILVGFSLGFSILGWWRWFVWQKNTIRGVVIVRSGWLEGVGVVMFIFLLALFGVILGIGIDKAFFS